MLLALPRAKYCMERPKVGRVYTPSPMHCGQRCRHARRRLSIGATIAFRLRRTVDTSPLNILSESPALSDSRLMPSVTRSPGSRLWKDWRRVASRFGFRVEDAQPHAFVGA